MMEKERNNRFERFMSSPQCRIYRHLVIQLMLFVLSLNAFGTPSEMFIFNRERLVLWFIFYGMLNVTCYLNMYVFVPRWFLTNKMGRYVAGVVGAVLAFLLLMMVAQPSEGGGNAVSHSSFFILANLLASFLTICIVIISTTTLLLFHSWTTEQQHVRDLEVTTRGAELRFLQQQINPHFLFNTLNNANTLLRHRPEDASQVLFKLEDLLRYQLDDCTRQKVPLTEDIRFLNDYLNLEKIRRDRFDYTLLQEGTMQDVRVPPLLFIPFVENAVKHNPDSGSCVSLSFAVHDDVLEFCCENTKSATSVKSDVGGLGLNNIRRRLALLYPGCHRLAIENGEASFRVRLIIDCKLKRI